MLIPPPEPPPDSALEVECVNMTKRFGAFVALDDVSIKVEAGLLPCAAGRERRGQEHAGQMSGGLLPARLRRSRGQRARAQHPLATGFACAGHRYGVPALHAGAEHDGGREPGHVARRRFSARELAPGAGAAGRVHAYRALQGSPRRPGLRAGGGREAEGGDPQAAVPALPFHHPRRADLGPHATGSGRGAGAAQGHGARRTRSPSS